MVALVGSNSNAFDDLVATPKRSLKPQKTARFLDATEQPIDEYTHTDEYTHKDEYAHKEDSIQDVEEYDQNISDNVQLPKISPAKELLAKVFGELLVRYISMREIARIYFQEVKEALNKWYTMYMAKE